MKVDQFYYVIYSSSISADCNQHDKCFLKFFELKYCDLWTKAVSKVGKSVNVLVPYTSNLKGKVKAKLKNEIEIMKKAMKAELGSEFKDKSQLQNYD